MSNRVVHFEIQADNIERAAKFYKEVFGWKIEKWEGETMEYWMIYTAEEGSSEPGINGGLIERPAKTPPNECGTNAYTCTIHVDDLDETESKILNAGGKIAMEKFKIPEVGYFGYFIDTEGNVFGVHQEYK